MNKNLNELKVFTRIQGQSLNGFGGQYVMYIDWHNDQDSAITDIIFVVYTISVIIMDVLSLK